MDEVKNEEIKKVKKVVKNKATLRKKNSVSKLLFSLINEEDIDDIGNYIIHDTIIPIIKSTVLDVIETTAETLFGNGVRSRRGSGHNVSYSKYYDERHGRNGGYNRFESGRANKNRCDYDDVEFMTMGDAKAALIEMENIIEEFGFVRVSEIYDMADITAPYTLYHYGWTSVASAEIIRTRNGRYIIKMPKAMVID